MEGKNHTRFGNQPYYSQNTSWKRRSRYRRLHVSKNNMSFLMLLSILLFTIHLPTWIPIQHLSNAFQQSTIKITPCKFNHKTFFRSITTDYQKHYDNNNNNNNCQLFLSRKDYCHFPSRYQYSCGNSLFDFIIHKKQLSTKLNSSAESTSSSSSTKNQEDESATSQEMDIPMPTENGGYTHTTASKAKISAANKGKIPWNKGKARSEEVKARIAAGVRKRNRERFLQKLEDMGLTEEEYEEQKKEERRKKDAERRARKTANGGYRLTDETKQKISQVLKEKHARGEVKKRKYVGPFRKGFQHSEETKQKIRESLKKKWAEDPEYQKKMRDLSRQTNNKTSSRQKISKTLKMKWQDPKFREKMLNAMRNNRTKSSPASQSQREKISAAMKKKWQDAEYRAKALKGMEEYRETLPPKATKKKTVSKAASTIKLDVVAVTPMQKATKKKVTESVTISSANARATKKTSTKKRKKKSTVELAEATGVRQTGDDATPKNGKISKEMKDDGDISRMREERRDLYDLLYGDEPDHLAFDDTEKDFAPVVTDSLSQSTNPTMSFFGGADLLDDENLDDFDPYGLDDC